MTFPIVQWKYFYESYILSNGALAQQIKLTLKIGLYEILKLTLPFIVETLDVTGHKLHLEKYQEWKEWDIESRTRTASLLGIFS